MQASCKAQQSMKLSEVLELAVSAEACQAGVCARMSTSGSALTLMRARLLKARSQSDEGKTLITLNFQWHNDLKLVADVSALLCLN